MGGYGIQQWRGLAANKEEKAMAEKQVAPIGAYARYHAYLLRLWQETEHSPFRLSLQAAATGEIHCFADLNELLDFLRQAAGQA
jgi:hypothetical protein